MSSAQWIRPEHLTPLTLVNNFYTKPLSQYDGYVLIKSQQRIGVYKKGDKYIVVVKGTTLTHVKDILDDARITGVLNGEVTLVKEVRNVIRELKSKNIFITGHSLGGRVALEIAKEFDLESAVFNPAAPFNNPLTKGPGPKKAVAYHIVGDVISSHTSMVAAEVVRVNMGYTPFQTLDAHTMSNFTEDKPVQGFYSVDQEDINQYMNMFTAAWMYADKASYKEARSLALRIGKKPIPESLRDEGKHQSTVVKFGGGFVYTLGKVASTDMNIRLVQKALGVTKTGLGFTGKAAKALDAVKFAGGLGAVANDLSSFRNATSLLDAGIDGANIYLLGEEILDAVPKEHIMFQNSTYLKGKEILDKFKAQSAGIYDEVYAKINFSKYVDKADEYLEKVAAKLNNVPKQLAEIQQKVFDKLNDIGPKPNFRDALDKGISYDRAQRFNEEMVTSSNRTRKFVDEARDAFDNDPFFAPKKQKVFKVDKPATRGRHTIRSSISTLREIKPPRYTSVASRAPSYKSVASRSSVSRAPSYKSIKPPAYSGKGAISAISKARSSIVKVVTTPAKSILRNTAAMAARTAGKVFARLVPVIAALDLGYTAYLLGKGIATGNYNDVVEHITGFTADEWKQQTYDLGHMDEYYARVGSKVPTCKMCPPGTALYWNGTECVVNPCEKRNGVWGIYDPKTNTCSYNGSSETPGVGIIGIDKPDLLAARVEQNEALKVFWAAREQWWQESNTQQGDGIILIKQKEEIRKKGAEVLARECP